MKNILRFCHLIILRVTFTPLKLFIFSIVLKGLRDGF